MTTIRKHIAFTLAEVLITLGIIGTVAALTIPNLIANYQKKQTITKLKQVYSTLTQAVQLSKTQAENFDWEDKNMTAFEIFNLYFRPYLNVTNENKYKNYKNNLKYKRLSEDYEIYWSLFQDTGHVLALNDGSLLFLDSDNYKVKKCLVIAVDINGFSPPNKIGKDFFVFAILADTTNGSAPRVIPYGSYNTSDYPFGEWKRENAINASVYGCNKKSRGMFCLALIMIDDWEIKKDYPW